MTLGSSAQRERQAIPWPDLRQAGAFPHDRSAGDGVEAIETHISHLFLTGDRVYKFRKAVDLGFLDFSSLAERNEDCLREIALNRRFAPDVYLGLAPIEAGPEGRAVVGPLCGDPVPDREHGVVMRRLPEGRSADALLRADALEARAVDDLAQRLARFHADVRLPREQIPDSHAWFDRVARPARTNLDALRDGVDSASWQSLRHATDQALDRIRLRLERRRSEGRSVEGHGDLRLEHVWFEPGRPPVAIDCLEFSRELRCSDPANDLAFLVMDLKRNRADRFARRFLQEYAYAADDFGLYEVVDFFTAYAACVRAKVELLADEQDERLVSNLEVAREALTPLDRGHVFLVSGIVGTGKSTVARQLARCAGGVVVASDRIRDVVAARRNVSLDDLYEPENQEAVYEGMLARAAPVLRSGRPVVLDATYDRARRRGRVVDWAESRGLQVTFVETRCEPEVARERLAQRARAGEDPSDAGPERYAPSRQAYEPIACQSALHHVVSTDRTGWRKDLARRIARDPSPIG